MGTTTDWVSKEAKAPPAKFDIADAADAVGATLLAGSAAQVFVISRVVRYICRWRQLLDLVHILNCAYFKYTW